MSAPTPKTDATLDFLDHMSDAGAMGHLLAISEAGKVVARSFGPTQRDEPSNTTR